MTTQNNNTLESKYFNRTSIDMVNRVITISDELGYKIIIKPRQVDNYFLLYCEFCGDGFRVKIHKSAVKQLLAHSTMWDI